MVIYLKFNYGNHSNLYLHLLETSRETPFLRGKNLSIYYASTELSADEQDKCNGDTHLKTRPIRKGDRVINY